jgi:integrase
MNSFDIWLSGLRTENTKDAYSRGFKGFLSFLDMTADEVLEKRARDMKSDNFVDKVFFENKLRQYLRHLDEKGKGYVVRSITYNSIKNFFFSFNTFLKLSKNDTPKGEYTRVIRPINKKEIQSLLRVSDVMERALILFLKDTGLSSSDVALLRLKNIGVEPDMWRSVLDEKNVPIPIIGIRKKSKASFHTFLGYESVEALHTYFEQREKGTQYLDSRKKGVPPEQLSKKSFVFRCKTKHNPMTHQHLKIIIQILLKKAGIKGVSSHSFRRFFRTSLENPDLGIHPAWIKRMMGHKLNMLEKAYSHPSEKQIRESYKKAIPVLSVLPRHVDEDRIRSLEEFREHSRKKEMEQEMQIERLEHLLKTAMSLLDKKA